MIELYVSSTIWIMLSNPENIMYFRNKPEVNKVILVPIANICHKKLISFPILSCVYTSVATDNYRSPMPL